MRQRAAVIIRYQTQILLIERSKPGRELYYVVPGGKMESGETPEQTARRELMEELHLELPELTLLPGSPLEYKGQAAHWIFTAHFTQKPAVSWQESHKQTAHNRYTPVWRAVADVAHLPTKPAKLSELL